jgi:cytochrome c oxidase cbb3-type subunit II
MTPNDNTPSRRFQWEMDELRIVVGAMVILSLATALLVVMPYILLRDVPPPAALKPYTDLQLVGRTSYIANGCIYCHSQQPRDIKQAPDAARGWEEPQSLLTMLTIRHIF